MSIRVLMVAVTGCFYASAAVLRVPGDFDRIQSAINAASQGDTVLVGEGIFNEYLVLQEGVCLMGVDRRTSIIWGRENRPVITGAADAQIRNLTIKGGRTGILCENVVMTIEGNIISDNAETGIHALVSLPVIRNNLVLRNKNTGIYLESVRGTRTLIEHNVCAENGYSGIMLAGTSEVLVQNNVFFVNRQFGIWVNEQSRRTRIIYNGFYGNRRQYNQYAVVDESNIALYPGYIPLVPSSYEYLDLRRRPLAGLGKEGADIGIIDD